MTVEYTYTKTPVDASKLTMEIVAEALITKTLEYVNFDGDGTDNLHIFFDLALDTGEETALDAIVAAHDGLPATVYLHFCRTCGRNCSVAALVEPTTCDCCGSTKIIAMADISAKGIRTIPHVTKTLTVDGNRTDNYTQIGSDAEPYKTIQAAITAASSGTLIDISQGTYPENLTLKPGVHFKSASGIQPGVLITGKVSWPSGAGTILMIGIYVLNTANHAVEFSGVDLQKLWIHDCKFETNSEGAHHTLNHSNTNAGSEIFMQNSLLQVLNSSGGAQCIETAADSTGSIGMDNTTIRLTDDIDHTAINIRGSVAYWHRMDQIRGRVLVATTASANISLEGMYANTLSVLDTNSAGTTVLSSVVISTTASPAITGAGAFAYSGVTYVSTGQGFAATLNGGAGPDVGALPFDSSLNVLYDNTTSGLIATRVKTAIDELQSTKESTFSKNTAFNKNFGTDTGTTCEGDDARLVDKRTIALSWASDRDVDLTVNAGAHRIPITDDGTLVIKKVWAMIDTAPIGAAIILDIHKNGTTIFTTQGNRPTIAIDSNDSGEVTNMDVTALTKGDYLTLDIDQIGSTLAGQNIVVRLDYEVTPT